MNIRKMVIVLFVVLVLIVAVAFYVLNRSKATMVSSSQEREYPLNGTMVSSGHKREYLLYVPKSYDRAKPTPLVISLHGALLGPVAQMGITQWNRVADKHGFIVVYPSGMTSGVGLASGALPIWPMDEERSPSAMPDVRFISELIDTLEAAYNIDPARIYANGLSNGGGVTFALSCTLSHRIAAFGPVAAAVTLPVDWCPDARPAPMIAFHGTGDRFTPYSGAKVWIAPEPFPNIPGWTANWARRNRCAPSPV